MVTHPTDDVFWGPTGDYWCLSPSSSFIGELTFGGCGKGILMISGDPHQSFCSFISQLDIPTYPRNVDISQLDHIWLPIIGVIPSLKVCENKGIISSPHHRSGQETLPQGSQHSIEGLDAVWHRSLIFSGWSQHQWRI